jgi:hypothetical protein
MLAASGDKIAVRMHRITGTLEKLREILVQELGVPEDDVWFATRHNVDTAEENPIEAMTPSIDSVYGFVLALHIDTGEGENALSYTTTTELGVDLTKNDTIRLGRLGKDAVVTIEDDLPKDVSDQLRELANVIMQEASRQIHAVGRRGNNADRIIG